MICIDLLVDESVTAENCIDWILEGLTPAIRHNQTVYSGQYGDTHADVWHRHGLRKANPTELEDGFTDHTGKFYNRQEAMKLVRSLPKGLTAFQRAHYKQNGLGSELLHSLTSPAPGGQTVQLKKPYV